MAALAVAPEVMMMTEVQVEVVAAEVEEAAAAAGGAVPNIGY